MSLLSRVLRIIIFVEQFSGHCFILGAIHYRLRSNPLREVLLLPTMTPSGLSIGMILKTKLFLRYLATSSSETRNYRIPSTIKDAFDSPGCTLDVITIALLIAISSGLELKFVMIAISQSLPAIVLQTIVFLILSLLSGWQSLCNNSEQSE